jgi:hypothetical protein
MCIDIRSILSFCLGLKCVSAVFALHELVVTNNVSEEQSATVHILVLVHIDLEFKR